MRHVLIIDDNQILLNGLERLLQGEECRTTTATNGRQGLAICQREAVDLVIMDLFMPEQDGFEVLKALQLQQPAPKTIAMSGNLDGDWLKMARYMGADEVMLKPLEVDHFLQAVRGLLAEA